MRNDDFYDVYDDDDVIPLKKNRKKVTGSGASSRDDSRVPRPAASPRQTPARSAQASVSRPPQAQKYSAVKRPASAQTKTAAQSTASPRPVAKTAPSAANAQTRSAAPAANAGQPRTAARPAQNSAAVPNRSATVQPGTQKRTASVTAARSTPSARTRTPARPAQVRRDGNSDEIPVAMPVRQSRVVRSSKGVITAEKKSSFKKGYLIYLAILILQIGRAHV